MEYTPKSPNQVLFQQSSFVINNQQGKKKDGDFNMPQPRFQTRNSMISNEPFTPTGFLRTAGGAVQATATTPTQLHHHHNHHHQYPQHQQSSKNMMAIPESPDLGLKQLKGRLGRFGRPQTIESLDRERQAAADEQN